MKLIALALLLTFAYSASAQKLTQDAIVETRDVALATTTFSPKKAHTVSAHWRLASHRLKLVPFVTQSFDRQKTTLEMKVMVATTFPSFTFAGLVITGDQKVLASSDQEWTGDSSWGGPTQRTGIENAALLHQIAGEKEAYLTVLIPGRSAPFDKISFKLSEDQLNDCRLMTAKYNALLAQ